MIDVILTLDTHADVKHKTICLRIGRVNQVDRLEMPVETARALRDQLSAQIERLSGDEHQLE